MTSKKTLINLFASFFVTLLAMSIAWGHATMRESSPEDGAVLSEAPTELIIRFRGRAKLISLTVTGSDNEPVSIDISDATSVDDAATVKIPPLQPDSYQVTWRAMGMDGHTTLGKFGFVVSAPKD